MNNPESFLDQFEPYNLENRGVRVPQFTIENSWKRKYGLSEDASNFDFLRALCTEGFKARNFPKDSPEYQTYGDRVKLELDTFKDLEFVDYILLVWMVIDFCKENKIPTGAGRGSCCGSLVLELIGVTKIDPMKYDLYFERFFSKTRAKKQIIEGITYLDGSLMCDIDMDVCYYNRGKVLKFLEEKFDGRVCKISTLNTLQGKLLIKECGKIIGDKSESEVNEVSSMIPQIFGKVRDIEDCYKGKKEEDGVKWKIEPIEEFVNWVDENKLIYNTALKLRGLIKNKGVHASGVLISYDRIEGTVPTELSSSKEIVCSYDMAWSTLTNLKLDVLGLRNVSVVDDACKNIKEKFEIDVNDGDIYLNLQDLKCPHGIFQLEAETIHKASQKVKPKNLEELGVVMALARPGALQFIDDFARYTNTGVAEIFQPFFEDILKPTAGVTVFQEQLMRMAHKIGFTLEEAEIIRRVVGKKKVKEMAEWEQKIYKKCSDNHIPKEVGEYLWKVMDASKDYSFNKSHSTAYAYLSAQTLYLKFKYPQDFFLSLLKMTRNEQNPIEEISKIQRELVHFGIKLLPPHLLKSEMDFSIEGKDIRFGLLSIKGISDKSIEKLNQFKTSHSNKFEVFQAAKESGLSIGVLSALIQAGALEGFKQSRSKVVLEAQLWNLLTDREKKMASEFGEKFEYDLCLIINKLRKFLDEKGKPFIKESRYETIKRKYEPYRQIYSLNSKDEGFANWFYENLLLGYTYNKTLKDIFSEKCGGLVNIEEISKLEEGEHVSFVGRIEESNHGVSKAKKTKYYKMIIKDEFGQLPVMIFETDRNEGITNCEKMNNGKLPVEGNIVIVKGQKKSDAIFISRDYKKDPGFDPLVSIQDATIYTKLSELKRGESEEKD